MLAVTLVLYYVTYPFPSRSKSEMDAMSVWQQAMRSPSIQTEDTSSPAFKLWNVLNPENDPFVHIHMETPVIVAPIPEDPGQDSHRQDPQNYGTGIRHLTWLFKIMILPMGTTIGLLYLLLRYLLKGTDALETYRTEPDTGSDDGQTPRMSPVEPSFKFSTLPRAFATDIELLAVNHDLSVIAMVSTENEVTVWNDGYHRLNVHDVLYAASTSSEAKVAISTAALDSQGRYCAIGTNLGTVAIWNIPCRKLSLDRVPHLMTLTLPAAVTDLGFIMTTDGNDSELDPLSQQNTRIVATCHDGGVFEISLHDTDVQSILSSHPETIHQSSLIRNQETGAIYVGFSYDDGMVEILSYDRTWHTVCLIQPGHSANPATQLYLSQVEMREEKLMVLAAATKIGAISLWNISTGELLHVLDISFGSITQVRLGSCSSQTCKLCGENTADAFTLAFSVGQTVYVYRCATSSPPKHCDCPVAKRIIAGDSFGYRSRSSSTTSASSSPKRTRQRLPSMLGLDMAEFPVSGHGVHSRKVSSDRENRRASELLPITQEEDGDGSPNFKISPGQGIESTLSVDFMVDINHERGGWDIIDGRWLCGLRRRSRSLRPSLPLLKEVSSLSHRIGLTPNVLDRWEIWTFDPSMLDTNIKTSTLLSLSSFSPTNSIPKTSEYPRLPFTRIFPIMIRSTACVAGFGNTTGIVDLAQSVKY